MKPKISIIIPVYNKARYLSTILEQIKNQSFKDFECILVDDGSTDGSSDICDSFTKQDCRFKVIHKDNAGVSAARNTGLDIACGDYITFIDADDEIENAYLEVLYAPTVKTGADMVVGGCKKFWDNSDRNIDVLCPFEGLIDINDVFKSFAEVQYKSGIYGVCCNKLLSAKIIENIRFNPKIRLAEDLEFYLTVYPRLSNIYFLPERLYLYRQQAENSSVIVKDKDIDYFTQLNIQLKLYRMLEKAGVKTDVVTAKIYNYVYLCIFYAANGKVAETCKKINELNLPICPDIKSFPFKKRRILKKYFSASFKTLELTLRVYRKLKGIKI
ncbi:MAG: glycosyltransferase [Ruminococcaceae bacterium]|nr:glycosyltransferase [Oscillospiraceae bacterium]